MDEELYPFVAFFLILFGWIFYLNLGGKRQKFYKKNETFEDEFGEYFVEDIKKLVKYVEELPKENQINIYEHVAVEFGNYVKVISKVNSALIAEIKSVLDSNSGTLDSTAATYAEILVDGNAGISDVTTYITSQLATETGAYDDIIAAVMDVVQQWTSYLRGPNQTNLGNKIDAPAMATDIAALTLGLEAIDLTVFEGVTAANLANSIATAIYTDSGFKYNGPASISNEQVITTDKTVDTDSVYNEVVMPAGKGLIGTRWDNIKEAQLGTSGDDTVTVTKSGSDTNDWDDIYYSGGAGDDVITGSGNNTHFIQGGIGDDTLKTTQEKYHRLEGGPGDDILSASNFNQVYYSGGTGSDLFVIEASSATWTASANFDGHDRNWDGTVDLIEFWQRPGAISDFNSGTDKIGLRGDWSNKTIVIKCDNKNKCR